MEVTNYLLSGMILQVWNHEKNHPKIGGFRTLFLEAPIFLGDV